MEEGGSGDVEGVPIAPPPLASLKKSASQRSFKEAAVSRRASFDHNPVPATITEETTASSQDFDRSSSFAESPPMIVAPAAVSSKSKPPSKPKTAAKPLSFESDNVSLDSKQSSIATRTSIRDYIRNERDTILRKNMALHETLKSEDNRRDQFQDRQLKTVARILPNYVQKLIRNLKRTVHKTMREKGGTPFSIVRGMFLHWDAHKNGALSYENFSGCLNHLGVIIPPVDLQNIFHFYSKPSKTGEARMGYEELLEDIQSNEPSVLEFVESTQHLQDQNEERFEEHHDRFDSKPQIVIDFIEALRDHVLKKMRAEGGTLLYHVNKVFSAYDYNHSSSMTSADLLEASRKKFNMAITKADCAAIMRFYDRKGGGEMDHRLFVSDICANLAPILAFEEQTPDMIEEAKKKLNANQFVKKPYKPPSNRVLEKLKDAVHKSLDYRLFKIGGSYKSWIHEAFAFWDPKATGKFTSWESLQGAIGRLGVQIPESECQALMSLFDKENRGEFAYYHLLNTLIEGDFGILADPPRKPVPERQAQMQLSNPLMKAKAALMQQDLAELAKIKHPEKMSATARAPRMVKEYVNKISRAVDIFVGKSKNSLNARDILHGTFLRFDPRHTGKVDSDKLGVVLKELGVRIKDKDIESFVDWFDCDGSRSFDYNELTRQIYGYAATDDMSRSLPYLPMIQPSGSSSAISSGSPNKLAQSLNSNPGSVSSFLSGSKQLPSIAEKAEADAKFLTLPSNVRVKETRVVKEARARVQRERLLEQRNKISERIESIEGQRKKIVEDYRARHKKEEY